MSPQNQYSSPNRAQPKKPARHHFGRWLAALVIVVGLAGGAVMRLHPFNHQVSASKQPVAVKIAQPVATGQSAAASVPNICAQNSSGQLVLVSISQRHLWACNGTSELYNSAVITGMENLPADLTPVGTYQIYGKYVNTVLKGSDSTGSWSDPVHYWMPWLHNQYGSYGFHDATWRDPSAFGNISPYSSDASHGCVELPLATASWLYNWAVIGTTVTIQA